MTIDFQTSVTDCAKRLLGCLLVREVDGQRLVARIVETEAYHQLDAASHSYKGMTPRTEVMFGPAGYAYVYFTYGMHYCMNIVCGAVGEGGAVLIRAVEPIEGHSLMKTFREVKRDHELTNGPAKLCQALGIDKTLNGHNLSLPPLQLVPQRKILSKSITVTNRIGISQDTHRKWRFYITGNPYISKP